MGADEGAGGARPGPTRRQLVASVGALATGALAGCTVDGEIEDSTTVFGHAFPYDSDQVQLNPWIAGSYPWRFYTLIFEVQSVATPDGRRRLAGVVEDLTVDDRTATVTYSDEYTWWNGEPVTARDQWVYERIQAAVSDRERPSVTLADEYTLVYEFDRALAEPLVRRHTVGGTVNTPRWLFGEWVERLDAETTAAARETVVEDLHTTTIPLDEAMEQGAGCGPYEVVETSINRLMLERYADHPRADDIAIPRLWFPVTGGDSWESTAVDARLDGGYGVLADLAETPPASHEQLTRFPRDDVAKLAFDWHNPHLARRGVRRAILAALPIPEVVAEGRLGDPTTIQTGLATPVRDRWLDAATVEGLRSYPVAADPERGAEFMRAAGYTREDDAWIGPEGDAVYLRLRTPTWNDWRACGAYVDETLSEFGFDVDFNQIPDVRLIDDVETHNYDVLLWRGGGHPFSIFDVTRSWPGSLGYGVTDPETATSVHDKPVEVTVPRAEGEGQQSVNLVELWRRLSGRSDRAATVDAIATFVRWWNASLPDVQLSTRVGGTWGNTRDFTWTGDATDYATGGPQNRTVFHALKRGLVRPAER